MDTFRLNPDAVRRVLPSAANLEDDRDDAERLAERVREVEPRVADDGGEGTTAHDGARRRTG